ncbi:MAG TPA: hypothetical protein VJR05_05585 [Acidimicrobiia bacterium]|nr:hypothetical protein [Acidimicrobiia bacterium]
MRNRLSAIVAAITAGILITGIAWAASDSRTEVTSNLDIEVNQETEIPVDGAGTIRLGNDGASLTILAAVAMEGYVVEVEVPQGREVEADFRGEGRRVQFNAELEDGVVRVRIRTEADATTSTTFDDNSTTSTTVDGNGGDDNSTTSTTIDDNGGDDNSTTSTTIDDNRGDNRGDDDDDNGTQLPSGPVVYDVSGAASVTVIFSAGGQIELGAVSPASGWTVEETKQDSDEVEVRLRSGEEEARFRLRVDNGQVRVEIERKD